MPEAALDQQLLLFGLTHVEAKIYLYLLNNSQKTILEISRDLNLPRTSIYDSSMKLIEKGLLQKSILYKRQKLRAFPIDILQTLIDKEKNKIENLENSLERLTTILTQPKIKNINTDVRYYHGVQGFQQMMWNALSAKEETIGYSEFGRVEIVGIKFLTRWYEKLKQNNILDRFITNPNSKLTIYLQSYPFAEYRKRYQHSRVINKSKLYISGDTTIYNNIFAVCYWKQGEIVGVEIENAELVKTQKSIFEEMWKLAQPVEKYVKNDV